MKRVIMLVYEQGSVTYDLPDLAALRKSGYYPVDMHLHTCHSDGLTRIPDLIAYARKRRIGVAITDHNVISGVMEAVSTQQEVLVIPGIELETCEGPHLLFYFYTAGDLEDYFRDVTLEKNRETPGISRNLPVFTCLTLAESYDCLRIAAHPYGYFGINRGVLKCVEKQMLPGVLDHLDGIEAICGGMMENLNRQAIRYAREHPVSFTGGSDAHILSEVGSVITGAPAETPEEFLTAVRRRENVVVGKHGGYLGKGATAGVIAWSFVPYTASQLGSRYMIHKNRTSRLLSRHIERFSGFRFQKEKTEEESEERGEDP